MKQLCIVALCLLCAVAGYAQEKKISATLDIKYVPADTAATTKVADTGRSDVTLLGYGGNMFTPAYPWSVMQFYWRIKNAPTAIKDTNFAYDTMIIALETSPSNDPADTIWTVKLLDTAIAQDSSASTVVLNSLAATSPSTFGLYGRLRVLRRDSLEATGQGMVNRDFSKVVDLFIIGR
jgi:hypothetical protein